MKKNKNKNFYNENIYDSAFFDSGATFSHFPKILYEQLINQFENFC